MVAHSKRNEKLMKGAGFMSANISNDEYVSFEEEIKEFYKQYITYNTGISLPLVFKGESKLYKYNRECCFILEHNNEYYLYTPLNYSVNRIFFYQEFTVEEIINRIIGYEVQNECDLDLPSQERVIAMDELYEIKFHRYEKYFGEFMNYTSKQFYDTVLFGIRMNVSDMFQIAEEDLEDFLDVIRAIFFYHFAREELMPYKFSLFEIRTLLDAVTEQLLKDSSIVVESYPNGDLKEDIKKIINFNGGK